VQHKLGRATVTIAVVNVAVSVGGAFSLRGHRIDDPWRLYAVVAAYAVVWIACAAYARSAASRGVPTWKVETIFTLLFVGTEVPAGFFVRSRLGSAGHVVSERHTLFLIVMFAVYAPIRGRHCVAVAAAGMASIVANVLLDALEVNYEVQSCDDVRTYVGGCILLGCMSSVCVLANLRLNRVHRSAWHFFSAVVFSTAQREQRLRLNSAAELTTQRNASAIELRMRTAEAAKGGRARLIRSVIPLAVSLTPVALPCTHAHCSCADTTPPPSCPLTF
jgi:hypothetical protein